jgi:hypothetical protein
MVNITLKKKIGHPLQSIISSCSQILEGDQIKEFERNLDDDTFLSSSLQKMV